MKTLKYIIILTFVFFITQVYCQQFKGLPTSNAKWVVSVYDYSQPFTPYGPYRGDYELVCTGDTVILGNTYSVLSNEFLYRNDYATQQVKVMINYTPVERLAFDFSKNVGDTIFNVYNGDSYYVNEEFIDLKVVDVDSVQINSTYYKRMKLIAYEQASDPNLMGGDTIVWVDGFGNVGLYGWFTSDGVSGPSDGLVYTLTKSKCFTFNGDSYEVVYPSGGINASNIVPVTNCETLYLSNKELLESKISIYPNPVIDNIYIKGIKQKVNVKIFNQLGQVVIQKTINPQNNSINLNNLTNGIYFLNVTNLNNGIIYHSKIIKN